MESPRRSALLLVKYDAEIRGMIAEDLGDDYYQAAQAENAERGLGLALCSRFAVTRCSTGACWG